MHFDSAQTEDTSRYRLQGTTRDGTVQSKWLTGSYLQSQYTGNSHSTTSHVLQNFTTQSPRIGPAILNFYSIGKRSSSSPVSTGRLRGLRDPWGSGPRPLGLREPIPGGAMLPAQKDKDNQGEPRRKKRGTIRTRRSRRVRLAGEHRLQPAKRCPGCANTRRGGSVVSRGVE